MEKDCPRCGVSFICRVENITTCQCAPVNLDELQLAYVKMHYPGCLCNSCLNEIKKYFYACEVNPRYKLIQALEMAKNKSLTNPPKKHGNMPL